MEGEQLLDDQLKTDWTALLDACRQVYFGVVDGLFKTMQPYYYWSADETEWATDIMFRNTSELDLLFPLFARYGMLIGDSANVLRFLGRIAPDAPLPPCIAGDVRGTAADALWLNPKAASLSPEERRKLSSRASYLIRILRAHGLIRKVPRSNRYLLTKRASQITATVLLAASVQAKQLTEIAA